MFKYICIIGSFLSLCGCYNNERNCLNFKTGIFEFETLIDGELAKTTFIRNDSIEVDLFKGKKDTASIRWINNCEYILKEINPKNTIEKKAIHFKILTTHNNTYTFEYGLVGVTKRQRGTAVKKVN